MVCPVRNELRVIPGDGDAVLVGLTQVQWARIDKADVELIQRFKWCAIWKKNSFYAVTTLYSPRRMLYMHQLILAGQLADHVNHDTLDNRRSNLRPATRSQNVANTRKKPNCTSRFKGVYRHAFGWRAQVKKNGVVHTKLFPANVEGQKAAALWYDEKARDFWGNFAVVNHAPVEVSV